LEEEIGEEERWRGRCGLWAKTSKDPLKKSLKWLRSEHVLFGMSWFSGVVQSIKVATKLIIV
jgi:hypothetical protein